MTSAIGDKVRVLQYVEGKSVLDVGCGSGDLVDILKGKRFDVAGVDASDESVERANTGRVVHGFADEVHDIFGEERFDTVICSSVFHEVFSYGNRSRLVGRVSNIRNALDSIYKVLKPGGRLIVRDGVSPGNLPAKMWVDDVEAVWKFRMDSPFKPFDFWDAHYKYYGPINYQDREVQFTSINESQDRGILYGTRSSLMEFAFTYTWGPEAYEREVQEFYGVYTMGGYKQAVQKRGFEAVYSESYIQQGYIDHLKGKVEFFDMPFPKTNAVWVYNKKEI